MTSLAMQGRVAKPRQTWDRRFFFGMALLVLGSTFVGFAPSYYLRFAISAPHPYEPLTPLVHLHGFVFTAWVLLFATQTGLVMAKRTALHRRLGQAAVVLVAIMLPLAVLVGIGGISRPLTAPDGLSPLSWAAISLLDVPLFGSLIVLGLLKRRDAAAHKRLMLLPMVDMLRPSLGRAIAMLGAPAPVVLTVPLVFLLPLVIYDLRTRRSLHPATLWGSLAIVVVTIGTPIVWSTQSWMDFAAMLDGWWRGV
jgi:hypothetical protein